MSRYNDLKQKLNKAGKRYFTNAILPPIPSPQYSPPPPTPTGAFSNAFSNAFNI